MGDSVVNLTVHGIGETCRTLDPGEDLTWVSVERFEQVMDAVVNRPDVRITFDDGNDSDLEIALPRLLERGLQAEFFVLAGELGKPGRLDEDGVRTLVASGMRVGSHGWAHRDWRRVSAREADQELAQAHAVLSEVSGRRVSRVAIPFGSYDRRVLARLRRAGVSRAYTSDGGRARAGGWLQARTSLKHDLDSAWIERVLHAGTSLRDLGARLYKRTRG
ncbi:polysaccharide deacetylase family protein [Nonomuraea endophytica]|uniref:Peptidoglycan/xylan/chitin deacetylase (PgdA/CDA1 family) n=1 Tax=Nonomuraea endophytica TaxID=714136 RepID=A0A7W8EDI9_9ACTN|nr:polysaccharide deacetylase family protein [Nonomuraea endophytica]MBB5075443.1 peptidoglycan/xylan/chitin deacetylase (PgdA/CDA1 family) [Nonomuraea endophytica]